MNRCPITYALCGNQKYSLAGLRLIHKSLTHLQDLPFTAQEQRREAALRMKRMSIQGVQPKLSAIFNNKLSVFELADKNGKYILKPQSDAFDQLPENEDLSMKLAALVEIETPLHGLVYSKDRSMCYFIKRFDRIGKKKKLATEDFAQLAEMTRDTKYNLSTEKLIHLIDEYTTFPLLEKMKFFRRLLFSFLIGNEDMHIKNFSLISRNNKVEFSPAYDLLNSTIALEGSEDELALQLAGKRRNFKRREIITYLGEERLNLNPNSIEKIETTFKKAIPAWKELINISFLSEKNKKAYFLLLQERIKRLEW